MNVMKKDQAFRIGTGFFSVERYRPGLIFENGSSDDWAFGPIALIDHARLKKGLKIKMHEHTNDEILSYIHTGEMLHEDSDGSKVWVSPARTMMMNAGDSFYHQESAKYGDVDMLQVIIRPREADMSPNVQFAERKIKQTGEWHLVAGPGEIDPPLEIRQAVVVYDAHGKAGQQLELPRFNGMTPFLYMMEGRAEADGSVLEKGDAMSGEAKTFPILNLVEDSIVVLFLADLGAEMTYAGSFSGPKNEADKRADLPFM
ncbi:pirin family protein [Salinicoccus albus]|uniref:pirin family protein n=1 Tax=Salinicoccus albus TaxID=418756 RepID=UPI000684EC4F|nr:pirin family protein [Salinicoccus albus]